MSKKVSVIIPYNHDRGWLDEAELSIKLQTHKNIEVIHSKSDNGVSYNLNRGIEQATGDFIKYLCEDDMLTPHSIGMSLKAMKNNDFIHGNALTLNHSDKITEYHAPEKFPTIGQMAHSNCIHGGSLMYRADVFERFGMFDESLWTGEEYEFNLRIMSQGAKLGFCESFLYIYRRHDEQKSLGRKANQHERKKAIRAIRSKYRNI